MGEGEGECEGEGEGDGEGEEEGGSSGYFGPFSTLLTDGWVVVG